MHPFSARTLGGVGAKRGQKFVTAARVGCYDGDDADHLSFSLFWVRLRAGGANNLTRFAFASKSVGAPSVLAPPALAGLSRRSNSRCSPRGRPMDPLIEGYRRFRAEVWPGERARYEALSHWGQSPEAMVIACSDLRVDPQTIFGAAPGELFVVRNVAALVPRYAPTPATMERARRWSSASGCCRFRAWWCRARAVRRYEGNGLWPAAAGAGLHRVLGRAWQGACRRRRGTRGTARTDRSGGRSPLARQSHDLPVDR